MTKQIIVGGVAIVGIFALGAAIILSPWTEIKTTTASFDCPRITSYEHDYVSNELLQELKSTTSDDTPDHIRSYHRSLAINRVAVIGVDPPRYDLMSIWVVDLDTNRWTQITSGIEFRDSGVFMLADGTLVAVRANRGSVSDDGDIYLIHPPYDLTEYGTVRRITDEAELFEGFAVSEDEKSLLFQGEDREVWRYEIASGYISTQVESLGKCK